MTIEIIPREDRGEIKKTIHEVTKVDGINRIFSHKAPQFNGIISIAGNSFKIDKIYVNEPVTKADIEKELPKALAYLKSYFTFKIIVDAN
jgi:hypothetical protein